MAGGWPGRTAFEWWTMEVCFSTSGWSFIQLLATTVQARELSAAAAAIGQAPPLCSSCCNRASAASLLQLLQSGKRRLSDADTCMHTSIHSITYVQSFSFFGVSMPIVLLAPLPAQRQAVQTNAAAVASWAPQLETAVKWMAPVIMTDLWGHVLEGPVRLCAKKGGRELLPF